MEQATLFLIIFQPICIVEPRVYGARTVAVRSMHDTLFAREVAPADEDVDEDTDSEDSMDSDDTEESENPFIQYFENQGFFR